MNKLFIWLLAVTPPVLTAATFHPVDTGSSITFAIKNFGINTQGSFSGLQGTILFDKNDLANSHFDISIDASTVNTGNTLRDNHLKQDTYFDVTKYPKISFVSSKIVATGDSLTVFGQLTIKNHTQVISFPFSAVPAKEGILFKGAFNINRKDFGVGGTSVISDNLKVMLSVIAAK